MALQLVPIPQERISFGRANFVGLTEDKTVYISHSSPEGYLVTMKGIGKRVKIFFEDEETKVSFDPVEIHVDIVDENGVILESGDFDSVNNLGAIKRERKGVYYYDFNLVSIAPKLYQFRWTYRNELNGELFFTTSYITVVTQKVWSLFPRLRNQIDKSRKRKGLEGVGYLEGNLLLYLQGGLDEINTFPPVTNFILDNYPHEKYGQLLIDSATIVAMYSQGLFAIDTDAPSYSDQGFSFTQDHHSKIDRVITALASKIKDQLKSFKLEFSQIGSVQVQVMPYFPISVVLSTAPHGGLFRNLFGTY